MRPFATYALASFGIILNAVLLGSKLILYAALGAHEATHCWTNQIIHADPADCAVTFESSGHAHAPGWGTQFEGIQHSNGTLEITREFTVGHPLTWWEHPLAYAIQSLALSAFLMPGALLSVPLLLAQWQQLGGGLRRP